MRSVGRSTLVAAALFLVVVAVLINSQQLFFMSTAMIVTLAAARIQSHFAIQGLAIQRSVPPAAAVGDIVTVQMTVASDRRIRRPLISLVDHLPSSMAPSHITPSLPIAPSADQAVETRYSFRPRRRGIHRWNRVTVRGTDALGLIVLERSIVTEPCELKVYPAPIPVSLTLSLASSQGTSEVETGRVRGSGLDSRGIREYVPGDPLKHVHWGSSARTGRLMVKEFDAGSGVRLSFLLQRTLGTEIGSGLLTSLEVMCGHALYLAIEHLRKQAIVDFPQFEVEPAYSDDLDSRVADIANILALVQADAPSTLTSELAGLDNRLGEVSSVVLFIVKPEAQLVDQIRSRRSLQTTCLVYDPSTFVAQGSQATDLGAADPTYLRALQDAGARVIVMPKVNEL
jgi:uncharacterized protein (DUF58 family)